MPAAVNQKLVVKRPRRRQILSPEALDRLLSMTSVLQINNAVMTAEAPTGSLSFTLRAGDIGIIFGPPCSGKTALLAALLGEQKLNSGTIDVLGVKVEQASRSEMRRLRQRIGVLRHDDILLSRHSLFDNVALPLRIGRREERHIHDRVTAQLAEVGLLGKMRRRAQDLNAEERRLVSLAQLAIKYPPLVLADLRSDETDLRTIKPALFRLATLGTAVLIFERRKTPDGCLCIERIISLRESLLVA